jgi:hypothetical protein
MDISPSMDDSVDRQEPLWLADGLEPAFLGLMMHFSHLDPIACYDYDKVIQILIEDGCTEEEALEHFEYNIIGSYIGERTPCYIRLMSLEEAIEEEEDRHG